MEYCILPAGDEIPTGFTGWVTCPNGSMIIRYDNLSLTSESTLHVRFAGKSADQVVPNMAYSATNPDGPSLPKSISLPKLYDAAAVLDEFEATLNAGAESESKTYFNVSDNMLYVNTEGKFAVTTNKDMTSWANVTGKSVNLSAIITNGGRTIKVKIFADDTTKRFESEGVAVYDLYKNLADPLPAPEPDDFVFNLADEKLSLAEADPSEASPLTMAELEYTYDASTTWTKMSGDSLAVGSKLGDNEVRLHIRRAAKESNPASDKITIKFNPRQAKPETSVISFNVEVPVTYTVETGVEYTKTTADETSEWTAGEGTALELTDIVSFAVRAPGALGATMADPITPNSVSVKVTPPPKGAAPALSINAVTGQVAGVLAGMEYFVDAEKEASSDHDNWVKVTEDLMKDGEFDIENAYQAGDMTEPLQLYGNYLYVRRPAAPDDEKPTLTSAVKSIFVPKKGIALSEGSISYSPVNEKFTGLNSTMEYRSVNKETDSTTKYTALKATTLSSTAVLDKASSEKVVYFQFRKKATGSGTDAVLPGQPITISIGRREPAPEGFTFEPATHDPVANTTAFNTVFVQNGHTDDAKVALEAADYYTNHPVEFSTNKKNWQSYTGDELAALAPAYRANGTGKNIYIRVIASDTAGSGDADAPQYTSISEIGTIMIPCRSQTPALKLTPIPLSSGGSASYDGDTHLALPKDPSQYAYSIDNGVTWTNLSATDTALEPGGYGKPGDFEVKDTAVTLQIKKVANATYCESAIQKIKITRAKAPGVKIDFNNERFSNVKADMQFRRSDDANTLDAAPWTDVSRPATELEALGLKAFDTKTKTMAIDFTNAYGFYYQFRLRATGAKPASQPTAPLLVVEKGSEPNVYYHLDYEKEMITASFSGKLQYRFKLVGDNAYGKWVNMPAKGLKLTTILNSPTTAFDENRNAVIELRVPASKTAPASKILAVNIPERPSALAKELSYDFENETTAGVDIFAGYQYSTNKNAWKTIPAEKIVIGADGKSAMMLPASNKVQKLYFRTGPVTTGAVAFGSKTPELPITVFARAKAPVYQESWIDLSAEEPAIKLPANMEFHIADHAVYGKAWTSADSAAGGVLLMPEKVEDTIFDGSVAVKVQIRAKGSNESKAPPSAPVTVNLAKSKVAPSLSYRAGKNTIQGTIKATMEYVLLPKGSLPDKNTEWKDFSSAEISAKSLYLGEFPLRGEEKDIYLRMKATRRVYHSQTRKIGTSVAQGAAPSGLSYNASTGRVSGITNKMEYSRDQANWTPIKNANMSFANLSPSADISVYFRVRGDATLPPSLVSAPVTIAVATAKDLETTEEPGEVAAETPEETEIAEEETIEEEVSLPEDEPVAEEAPAEDAPKADSSEEAEIAEE